MGIAYSVERFMKSLGKEGTDPDTLDTELKNTVMSIIDSMTQKQLKDFASTKHKNLKENKIKNFYEFLIS